MLMESSGGETCCWGTSCHGSPCEAEDVEMELEAGCGVIGWSFTTLFFENTFEYSHQWRTLVEVEDRLILKHLLTLHSLF